MASTFTADDRAPRALSVTAQGPVPPTVGAIVIGSIIGLALLRKAFRGA